MDNNHRVGVRRLILHTKKLVTAISSDLILDDKNKARNNFLTKLNPILWDVMNKGGIYDYRLEVDNPKEDDSELNCRVLIRPTYESEYITLDINIANKIEDL